MMDSIAFVDYNLPKSGSKLKVVGELRFAQKELLAYHGYDFRFNDSIVNQNFIFERFIDEYSRRNCKQNSVLRKTNFFFFSFKFFGKQFYVDLASSSFSFIQL